MDINLSEIIKKISEITEIKICWGGNIIKSSKVSFERVNIIGLELAGFFKRIKQGQIQIIDSSAIDFMEKMDEQKKNKYIAEIFGRNIPVLFYTDGNEPDKNTIKLAGKNNVPLLSTQQNRWDFVRALEGELEKLFAPVIDYRGTVMEVFGVGVLITGKSSVGKSECSIDLLQRGHRLIGDDVVEITRRGKRVLLSRGKYPISNRMELRGIGIIDVMKIYGISAVKNVTKIELVINLERWKSGKGYERLGLDEKKKEILGIPVTFVELPVAPGRNTAILVEVAAMNLCLRKKGIVPAQELEKEVIKSFKSRNEKD